MRIAVVSAIGAVGRESLGGKRIFEKIRIGVGADPALVGDLKISSGNVGEERCELERAKFEFDAGAAPLFLKSRADEASLFIGGTFQREVQAHAVLFAGKARGVEKLSGAGGIVGILRDIRFGGPVIGRKHAGGELGLAVEEIADKRVAIGREGERLAEFAMGQRGVLEIE